MVTKILYKPVRNSVDTENPDCLQYLEQGKGIAGHSFFCYGKISGGGTRMKKRKKKAGQIILRCPYCGRNARIRPASYVYGQDTLDTESFLYVCDGYPACDAYVGAHKESRLPKGTLANGRLRHKRILAHRALDAIWKRGYMTRHSAYIWLQTKLFLREQDMHIAKFSDYYCEQTIRECNEFIKWHQENRKGGKKCA